MSRTRSFGRTIEILPFVYSSFTAETHNRRAMAIGSAGWGNMDLSNGVQAMSGPETDCSAGYSKTRILIIDDDDMTRRTVALMLEQLGYEVLEASNGERGLAVFRDARPPLVITDLIMPVKEGMETLIEIKEEQPATKVLAMSGGGRAHPGSLLTMAQHLGADHTLSKPFSIRELAGAIDKVMAAQPA